MKVWKIENWEEDVRNTEVTELDTLREHTEYINVVVIKYNIVSTVRMSQVLKYLKTTWSFKKIDRGCVAGDNTYFFE